MLNRKPDQIPSVNVYLIEEHSCQISYWLNLKRWRLGLFSKRSPQQQEQHE